MATFSFVKSMGKELKMTITIDKILLYEGDFVWIIMIDFPSFMLLKMELVCSHNFLYHINDQSKYWLL